MSKYGINSLHVVISVFPLQYHYQFAFMQVLAKKMTVLYKLAKGQLSRQYHYDFGLRALRAVLVMAGELKRGSPDLNEVGNVWHCDLQYMYS